MLNRDCFVAALLAMTLSVSSAHAEIGRVLTKRERLKKEMRESGRSVIPARPVHQSPAAGTADYEKIYESFLREDYAAVDRLAGRYLLAGKNKANTEDVLYLQALSLLKLNRSDEARQKLRELEYSFASSERKAGVSASIGDSYFYEGDFSRAAQSYEETLRKYPASDQTEYLQSQLNTIRTKSGDLTPEMRGQGGIFTVQVGSFSSQKNARALVNKLVRRNYEAYIEEGENGRMYRVRVGRVASKGEANNLAARLKNEGYPTKIYP